MKDEFARVRIHEIRSVLGRKSRDETEKLQRLLEVLFSLPFDASHYAFGEIDGEDKRCIEELATSAIGGERLRTAVALVSSRGFGDVSGYKRVIESYFRDFLGVRGTFRPSLR